MVKKPPIRARQPLPRATRDSIEQTSSTGSAEGGGPPLLEPPGPSALPLDVAVRPGSGVPRSFAPPLAIRPDTHPVVQADSPPKANGLVSKVIGGGNSVRAGELVNPGAVAPLISDISMSLPLNLGFERSTVIWKALHPVTVSDSAPDTHGHQRRSPAVRSRGHLYEGMNDRFENRVCQESTIVARGLAHFPPAQKAVLMLELKAAERIFSSAKDAIVAGYGEARGIYECFFGIRHALVIGEVCAAITKGHDLAKEYQGPWGQDKFVAVGLENHRQAWMFQADFHGRFFIGLDHVKAGESRTVMGHEMLHMNRVNRFKTVGPGATDFFYLDIRMQEALARPVPSYDLAVRGVSEVIMQGGLTVDYLQGFTTDLDFFTRGVSEHLGIPNDLDAQTAVDLFNNNPVLRAWMAARNADSIVYAAESLQHLHDARTEDKNLLFGLLTN